VDGLDTNIIELIHHRLKNICSHSTNKIAENRSHSCTPPWQGNFSWETIHKHLGEVVEKIAWTQANYLWPKPQHLRMFRIAWCCIVSNALAKPRPTIASSDEYICMPKPCSLYWHLRKLCRFTCTRLRILLCKQLDSNLVWISKLIVSK
jgi:hypothetical protein